MLNVSTVIDGFHIMHFLSLCAKAHCFGGKKNESHQRGDLRDKRKKKKRKKSKKEKQPFLLLIYFATLLQLHVVVKAPLCWTTQVFASKVCQST